MENNEEEKTKKEMDEARVRDPWGRRRGKIFRSKLSGKSISGGQNSGIQESIEDREAILQPLFIF